MRARAILKVCRQSVRGEGYGSEFLRGREEERAAFNWQWHWGRLAGTVDGALRSLVAAAGSGGRAVEPNSQRAGNQLMLNQVTLRLTARRGSGRLTARSQGKIVQKSAPQGGGGLSARAVGAAFTEVARESSHKKFKESPRRRARCWEAHLTDRPSRGWSRRAVMTRSSDTVALSQCCEWTSVSRRAASQGYGAACKLRGGANAGGSCGAEQNRAPPGLPVLLPWTVLIRRKPF